jgi:hypothetical protein|tara:strand:+ start:2729 stop:3085 length:357 start_codon:yes stop_codon:yes gene_type:complete
METKEQLIHHIKEWIGVDEEIKSLQKEIRIKKQKQKDLTQTLMEVMKTNEIDCFDLKDGKLLYTKNKTKQTINKKYLMTTLIKCLEDPKDAEKVTDFILDNREEKVKENIRRKVDKKK